MTAQADSASLIPGDDALAQRRQLRRQLRAIRQQLPRDQRQQAAQRVASHLQRAGWLRAGLRIGVYLALPEELSLAPTIRLAQRLHCQLWAPQITHMRLRRLRWIALDRQRRYRRQRWGILEPQAPTYLRHLSVQSFDVLLIPLVGFDTRGGRLGMGAGFYDRLLNRRRQAGPLPRPLMVGVAFAKQQTDTIPMATHDVFLDAVVTEHGVMRCRAHALP